MTKFAERARKVLPSGLAMLGIGGCTMCCAVPLLLTVGLLSGGATAAMSDWMPGIAAALLAAAGLARWWISRRPGCGPCGSGDGVTSCACTAKAGGSESVAIVIR